MYLNVDFKMYRDVLHSAFLYPGHGNVFRSGMNINNKILLSGELSWFMP